LTACFSALKSSSNFVNFKDSIVKKNYWKKYPAGEKKFPYLIQNPLQLNTFLGLVIGVNFYTVSQKNDSDVAH